MTYHYYGDKNADIVLIQPVGDHDLPEIEIGTGSFHHGKPLRYLAMRASAMERKTLWRRY